MLTTDLLRITVEGEPRGKARPRHGRGRTWTPAATAEAEERIRWELKAAGVRKPVDCDVELELVFYSGDHIRRDLDNLVKLVLDAMNKIAFADDSQVVSIIASVHRGADDPRTELTMREVTDGEADAA